MGNCKSTDDYKETHYLQSYQYPIVNNHIDYDIYRNYWKEFSCKNYDVCNNIWNDILLPHGMTRGICSPDLIGTIELQEPILILN